jgi:hypothetical protein
MSGYHWLDVVGIAWFAFGIGMIAGRKLIP